MIKTANGAISAQTSKRPALKLFVFALQIIVLIIVIFFMASSELGRWRELSEVHVNTRGMTLVRAVEPHVVRYINAND
ncbi:MAG TPA: hypothetical protein PLM07_13435, partial [Candidatus Rifleibacterium sp.]|nr:hypothetical protein [Candidatus Rifleibacterium sp.]